MPALICNCPDLRIDPQELLAALARQGLAPRLVAPLCTPAGLAQWRRLAAAEPGPWRIGACAPEVNPAFFQRLKAMAGGAAMVMADLLSQDNLEAAMAALALAEEAPAPAPMAAAADVLVVGGGVGGCQAALDLANAGVRVYLLESSLSIGGAMAQLDRTFPTLDCSICILGPKLVEVAAHPNIELLTYAHLDKISGQAGDFTVEFTVRPRYVNMGKCVGCGACASVCPVIVPSRWNLGLKPRKSIRIIFAQAVPLRATIEREYCIECQMCAKVCERSAINLLHRASQRQLSVGAIILEIGRAHV